MSLSQLWAMHADTVLITLQLAAITTICLLVVSCPLAWWLARARPQIRAAVAPLLTLPLILPPTVLGFYLLLLLGPQGPIGSWLAAWGVPQLVFSFPGLVLGSLIHGLPFGVHPMMTAFMNMGERPLEVAATLRAGPIDRFFTVILPLTKGGLMTAAVLCFAHTIGEFGVVLMIGGSIPGQTRVLSIAIFEHVETLEYAQAHILAGGMLGFSLLVLIGLFVINRTTGATRWS